MHKKAHLENKIWHWKLKTHLRHDYKIQNALLNLKGDEVLL